MPRPRARNIRVLTLNAHSEILEYADGSLIRESRRLLVDGKPITRARFTGGYDPTGHSRNKLVYFPAPASCNFDCDTLDLKGGARLVGWVGPKNRATGMFIETRPKGTLVVRYSGTSFIGVDGLGGDLHYDVYTLSATPAHLVSKSVLETTGDGQVLVGTREVLFRLHDDEPWEPFTQCARTLRAEGKDLHFISPTPVAAIKSVKGVTVMAWIGKAEQRVAHVLVAVPSGKKGTITFAYPDQATAVVEIEGANATPVASQSSPSRTSRSTASDNDPGTHSGTELEIIGLGTEFGSSDVTSHEVRLESGMKHVLIVEGQQENVTWSPEVTERLEGTDRSGRILHVNLPNMEKPSDRDLPEGVTILGMIFRSGGRGYAGIVLLLPPRCESLTFRKASGFQTVTLNGPDQDPAEVTAMTGLRMTVQGSYTADKDDGTLTPQDVGDKPEVHVIGETLSIKESGEVVVGEHDIDQALVTTLGDSDAHIIHIHSTAFPQDTDELPTCYPGITLITARNGHILLAVKSNTAVVTLPDPRDDNRQFKFTQLMGNRPIGTLENKPRC